MAVDAVDAPDSLVGGLGDGDDHGVEAGERGKAPGAQEGEEASDDDEGEGDEGVGEAMEVLEGVEGLVVVGGGKKGDVEDAHGGGCDQDGEEGYGKEKEKEISVVSFPDAISHPGTMMVELGDADVARVAMLAPGRSKYVAG